MKLCECGCGQPAPIYNQTNRSRGMLKGRPARFIKNHHLKQHNQSTEMREASRERGKQRTGENSYSYGKKGELHPTWKGGRNIDSDGYVRLYLPDHPSSGKDGYVLEHRLTIEEKIGRRLKDNEHVHHKDDNRQNNDSDNLEILSIGGHMRYHALHRPRSPATGRFIEAED